MFALKQNYKYILAIESSCDDTAVAVLRNTKVLSNVIHSQKIHSQYGGVVTELASRDHLMKILPTIHGALTDAKVKLNQIDAIAYTIGPGLIGSLLVGSATAKSLAMVLNVPLIEVHHMQAHLLAHYIDGVHNFPPAFPFLGVTLSGGHTQIAVVNSYFDMELIGTTIDDAIGEAFDKCGKILGLSYPAGPQIDNLSSRGNSRAFVFPIPKVNGLDLSYSGIKTAFRYFIEKNTRENKEFIANSLNDICASIQGTLIENIMRKIKVALKQTELDQVVFGGGVSANSELRRRCYASLGKIKCFFAPIEFTTDNAAMIGIAGYYKLQKRDFGNLKTTPKVRMAL